MSKKQNENFYGRKFNTEVEVAVFQQYKSRKGSKTNPDNVFHQVQSRINTSPEMLVAMHNTIQSYAQQMLDTDRARPKGERTMTRKQEEFVLGGIAYCNMVISNLAPVLYRDLKLEAAQEELLAQTSKEPKTDIVTASPLSKV